MTTPNEYTAAAEATVTTSAESNPAESTTAAEAGDVGNRTPEAGVQSNARAPEILRTGALERSSILELPDGPLERVDGEDGPVEVELPVSSEYEVRRDWPFEGLEVLEHTPEAVNLERFRDGAAVITGGHYSETLVGAVVGAEVRARRLYARVRFGSIEEARRELTLIREGVRRNVSIRYRIDRMERTTQEGELDRYTAKRWTPIHVALVADPADPSVGFSRSDESRDHRTEVLTLELERSDNHQAQEGQTMTTESTPAASAQATPAVDPEAVRRDVREQEDARRREILSLGRQFNRTDDALEALAEGATVAQFKDRLLDSVKPGEALESTQDPAHLGMENRDVRRYSVFRLLRHLADPGNQRLREEAGLELEASRTVENATDTEARGAFVPTDILRSELNVDGVVRSGLVDHMTHGAKLRQILGQRAEMRATVATLGADLVGTDHLGGSFIDVLRNTSAVMPRATVLSGLQGNVEIPKKTAATAGSWVATEGANTAEDDMTIDEVTMAPHDVGAHVILRRRLMLQASPDVENMARMDLAMGVALAIDAAAISGTGSSGQPTGFLNAGTIGAWSLVSDPPATHAADPQWSDVLALWKLVASNNALFGDLGWLMGANHAAHFLGRDKGTDTGRFVMESLRELLGYPVVLSEQCPADTVAFLNFRQVLVGLWGGLDLLVDPYSASKSASVVVRAIQSVDTALRQEDGVAAWQDSTVS